MTLTAQQTFDTVVTHLFTQKRKAATSRTYADSEDGKTKTYLSCKYRTPEGLKCAAGCLIKDEFYDEWFEGKRVTAYEVKAALVASGISNHLFDSGLVYTLQAVHDDYPESHWFSKLREVAKGWGLNTEALDQYGEVQLTDTPDDRWPQSTDVLPV